MSQKVNSKNLSYDNSLPPFLAALQAQAKGSQGPDPIVAAQRRSAKKRSGSEEAEDAPLVVDEHGNTVSLDVDKEGAVKERDTEKGQPEAEQNEDEKLDKPAPESRTQIGGRKRKVGKVVGEDAPEKPVATDDDKKSSKDDKDGGASADKNKASGDKKAKKKAKKIKLSFDED